MEPGSSFFLSRRSSRTSYTEDDDQHNRMSDIEESHSNTNHSPFGRRRSSSCTSIPSSPSSSSYNKMSVDSDDGRSIGSPSYSTAWGKQRIAPLNDTKNVRRPTALFRQWQQEQQQTETPTQECQSLKSSMDGTFSAMDQDTFARPRLRPSRSSTTLSPHKKQPPTQKEHPERRTVRRTSLLLKSKALSRVMHQAEEETHLADLEMRQEHGATSHLKSRYPDTTPPPPPLPLPSAFPFPPWATTTPSMPIDISSPSSSSSSSPMAYQCSKLNPELEMTNFQFENLPSPMQSSFKSIKRKASEDRLLDTTCLSGLKRRAVSPSVSLSGSPILAASTSPPATSLSSSSITSSPSSHASYFQCSGNAAARTSPSQSSSKGFNLHEASGGISRMSLSE